MSKVYRSPDEAYPFLADSIDDLRCDFELLTDRLSSKTGILRAICSNELLAEELLKISDLIYHANPSLRTKVTLQLEEIEWLKSCVLRLQEEVEGRCNQFVLPIGNESASLAHVLRVDCKEIVRLIYRHIYGGHEVEPLLIDFFNLLSGYFFMLALKLNALADVDEISFVSRNY